MISRTFLSLATIFKDVEPIIKFGIRVGLILGLGLAICANLIIENIMDSYSRFIQQSLIGINGALYVETTPASGQELLKMLSKNIESILTSYAWDSEIPIKMEFFQESEKVNQKVRTIILEKKYLHNIIKAQPTCEIEKIHANALGNSLFFNMISRFNLKQSVQMGFQQLPTKVLQFPDLASCNVNTGMMTDYPLLFLTWEGLGLEKETWSKKIQIRFLTKDQNETENWYLKLSKYCQELMQFSDISEDQLSCTPINIFNLKEMKIAAEISDQAKRVSTLIQQISLAFVFLILFFGISMLKELKKDVIKTLRMLGVNKYHITAAFILKGAFYGFIAAFIGITLAIIIRMIMIQLNLISFEVFFIGWDMKTLLITVLFSIGWVALFSGMFTYFSFQWEKYGIKLNHFIRFQVVGKIKD